MRKKMENNSSYEQMTDEALLERLRAGENEIMDYLMEKYKVLVRYKAKALYLIGGENDDLIQEGMIGLFKAVRDFREGNDASFRHFAEICISRQMYHAIEASHRKKHAPLNTYISLYPEIGEEEDRELAHILSKMEANPEQIMIEQENYKDMQQKLLDSLSKLERQVLDDYLQGMNYQEIAKKMDKTPKSIDNAIQRIKQKMRSVRENNE